MSEAIDLFEQHEKQPDFLAAVTDYYCDQLEAERDPESSLAANDFTSWMVKQLRQTAH